MQRAGDWTLVTSAQQFFRASEEAPAAVAYVTAPWCFRCGQVAAKVNDFPSDWPQVVFLKVDLQETEDLGELLDIHTLPTFLLLKAGIEVHRLEGVPQQRAP